MRTQTLLGFHAPVHLLLQSEKRAQRHEQYGCNADKRRQQAQCRDVPVSGSGCLSGGRPHLGLPERAPDQQIERLQFGVQGEIQGSRRARCDDHIDLAALKCQCSLGPVVELLRLKGDAEHLPDFFQGHFWPLERRLGGVSGRFDHTDDDRLQRAQVPALGFSEFEWGCRFVRLASNDCERL
ncbi:hypothetical protein [Caballeronia sp. J97]|uniref:hypothetical protein n=1 Tax=Caballeronia sp. J97 TaxID=2805429 RepID=UPI002AB00300|nr:hypothetical protein [Caballeronia sp. J97]